MSNKVRIILGLSLISFGVFLQVLWLIFCFGSIFVGILLLLFAPSILFFPFNLFFQLGFNIIGRQYNSNSYSYSYRYKSNQNNYHNNENYHYSYTKPATESTDKYYEILESNKNDDFNTIKKNYRRLMKKYHYDTIASTNPSEDQIKHAEEKSKQINEAYSIIKGIFRKV